MNAKRRPRQDIDWKSLAIGLAKTPGMKTEMINKMYISNLRKYGDGRLIKAEQGLHLYQEHQNMLWQQTYEKIREQIEISRGLEKKLEDPALLGPSQNI